MIDPPWAETPDLTIVIDFASPHSYLALEPTLKLCEENAFSARWCQFTGPVVADPAAYPRETRSDRHRYFRARYQRQELARYAAVQDLDLSALDDHRPTLDLAWGLIRVSDLGRDLVPDYLRTAFRCYWQREPVDGAAVRGLLDDMGLESDDRGEAHDTDLEDRMQAIDTYLKNLGIFNTPTYLIGEELFIGRAHLPMIRWILQGRTGQPPI
ncbi:MAG: DsbA family protein [Proteobacteria bacterium]|nr:DsbA family protein [Pseudomonadota bacterium]